MNRLEFRQLAEDRAIDAKALLDAGRWSAAYYLAGYAIECSLKTCVLRFVEETGAIFEDRKFAEKCWTHDFEVLLAAAKLKDLRDSVAVANPDLGKNWLTVSEWTEDARYYQWTEPEARELFASVSDNANGVLQWIRAYW